MKKNSLFFWNLILALSFSCSDKSSQGLMGSSLNTPPSGFDLWGTRELNIAKYKDPDFSKLLVYLSYVIKGKPFGCNGFIVAPYKILTNGHCFLSDEPDKALQDLDQVDITQLRVRFGHTVVNNDMKEISGSSLKAIRFFDNGRDSLRQDILKAQEIQNSFPDNGPYLAKERQINFYLNRYDIAVIELDPTQILNAEAKDFFKELPAEFSFASKDLDILEASSQFKDGFVASFSTPNKDKPFGSQNIMLRLAPIVVTGTGLFRQDFVPPTIFSSTLKRIGNNGVAYYANVCEGDSGSVLTLFDPESQKHLIFGMTTAIAYETQGAACGVIPYFLLLPKFHEWLNLP